MLLDYPLSIMWIMDSNQANSYELLWINFLNSFLQIFIQGNITQPKSTIELGLNWLLFLGSCLQACGLKLREVSKKGSSPSWICHKTSKWKGNMAPPWAWPVIAQSLDCGPEFCGTSSKQFHVLVFRTILNQKVLKRTAEMNTKAFQLRKARMFFNAWDARSKRQLKLELLWKAKFHCLSSLWWRHLRIAQITLATKLVV